MKSITTVAPDNTGIQVFSIIWFGQFISTLGGGLTNFALSVWIYQRSGSITNFTLLYFITSLPGLLLLPLAGALVDRWDKRRIMLCCDIGSGLSILAIALIIIANLSQLWLIYIPLAISAICGYFNLLAFSTMVTLLVPKEHLGRANGMLQISEATARIVSPVLASFLILAINVYGVLLIDFATFLFSLVILLSVHLPKSLNSVANHTTNSSIWQDAVFGWTYIKARPGLQALLLLFTAWHFLVGMVTVLVTPLVLSFASANELGRALSISGCGLLIGGLVMSIGGGPKRRVYGTLGFMLLQGPLLFLLSVQPNILFVTIAICALLFTIPIIISANQAIWQTKVAPDIQGRVFAMRRMITWVSLPLAYLVAGPLVDRIFEPLLAYNGLLAGSVGRLIGVGPGRGIGFLFITLACLHMLITTMGYLYPSLRRLEKELPDAH
ncbi:MAG: MFS transporter [Acidobacteriota bacterium]